MDDSEEQEHSQFIPQPAPLAPGSMTAGAGAGDDPVWEGLAVRLREPSPGSETGPLQAFPMPSDLCGTSGLDRKWWAVLDGKDASLPMRVSFRWEFPADRLENLRYDLTIRAEDGSGETFTIRGLREQRAEVENLRVGTRYTWKVRARLGSRVVGRSAEGAFRTHPALPRWIHADGGTNIRDLGGWPLPGGRRVRQGMIFRGSELNSHCVLTPQGAEVLEKVLKIRTDLDLRGPGEERIPVLDGARVDYINIPLASYDMIASPQYSRMYRELFANLAQPERYPVYMHCWGGADRTGTVAFLVGALLGMCLEDLITDYELTSLSVWGERRGDAEAFQEMLQILALFAPGGSSLQYQVERYLRVVGVEPEEMEAIRRILIE